MEVVRPSRLAVATVVAAGAEGGGDGLGGEATKIRGGRGQREMGGPRVERRGGGGRQPRTGREERWQQRGRAIEASQASKVLYCFLTGLNLSGCLFETIFPWDSKRAAR